MRQFFSKMSLLNGSSLTFANGVSTFLVLIFLRLFVEYTLYGGGDSYTLYFWLYEFTHTILFFALVFLFSLGILRYFTQKPVRLIASFLLLSFIFLPFPPLIDFFLAQGSIFWSFYQFDSITGLLLRYVTFFGDSPTFGVTYGTRILAACFVLLGMVYTYISSRSYAKTFLCGLSLYTLLFILGSFPAWLTFLLLGFSQGFFTIGAPDVAQAFLSPLHLYGKSFPSLLSSLNIKMSIIYSFILFFSFIFFALKKFPQKAYAVIKNTRLPQIIYHSGLYILGMAFAVLNAGELFDLELFNILAFGLVLLAILCAWITSVIVNDLYDINIDTKTNSSRPLIQKTLSCEEYKTLGVIFFFCSLLFGIIIHVFLGILLILYQGLAWIYSAWPLRLKRIPFIATFISALASLVIFFIGYFLVLEPQDGVQIPSKILALLIISYTCALMVKDFKDIEGDKADHVYTLPVLLGAYKAKMLIGISIFFLYLLSVWIINAPSLWIWAFILGGASFIVLTTNAFKKASDASLPWILLGITSCYIIVIFSILFLPFV